MKPGLLHGFLAILSVGAEDGVHSTKYITLVLSGLCTARYPSFPSGDQVVSLPGGLLGAEKVSP
jgi:hypothetical protein